MLMMLVAPLKKVKYIQVTVVYVRVYYLTQ